MPSASTKLEALIEDPRSDRDNPPLVDVDGFAAGWVGQ
jgi:hypothetical protein